jgi:hypothetical protein
MTMDSINRSNMHDNSLFFMSDSLNVDQQNLSYSPRSIDQSLTVPGDYQSPQFGGQ